MSRRTNRRLLNFPMLDSAPFERECSSVRATYGVRTPTTPTTPVEVRGVRRLVGKSSVITLYNYTTVTYLVGKSSENTLRSLQGNLPIIYILVYIVASLVVTHYPAMHCSECHVVRMPRRASRRSSEFRRGRSRRNGLLVLLKSACGRLQSELEFGVRSDGDGVTETEKENKLSPDRVGATAG
jgi:hypothetical protein